MKQLKQQINLSVLLLFRMFLTIQDIKKAKKLSNKNIEGIIIGKAIYDGDIKLDELAKEIQILNGCETITIRRKIRNGEKLGFSERARVINKGLPSKAKKEKMLKNRIIPCLDVKNGRVVRDKFC